jgi:hypothetical protein
MCESFALHAKALQFMGLQESRSASAFHSKIVFMMHVGEQALGIVTINSLCVRALLEGLP